MVLRKELKVHICSTIADRAGDWAWHDVWNLKAYFQWHTSSNKATPSQKRILIFPKWEVPVYRHSNIWVMKAIHTYVCVYKVNIHYFIFIGYLMFLHFKCQPLFLLSHTLSPSLASVKMLPLPPKCPGILLTGEVRLHRTKGFSSYKCQTMPSSVTYVAGAMGPSMSTHLLVV